MSIAAGCLTGALVYGAAKGGEWAMASIGRSQQAEWERTHCRTAETAAYLKAEMAALPRSEEEHRHQE